MILLNMTNTFKEVNILCIYKFCSYLQRHTFSIIYFKLSIQSYGFFIEEVLPKGNRIEK